MKLMFTATLKTYIMLFEEETARRKIISICEYSIISISHLTSCSCPKAGDDLIIYKASISMH